MHVKAPDQKRNDAQDPRWFRQAWDGRGWLLPVPLACNDKLRQGLAGGGGVVG